MPPDDTGGPAASLRCPLCGSPMEPVPGNPNLHRCGGCGVVALRMAPADAEEHLHGSFGWWEAFLEDTQRGERTGHRGGSRRRRRKARPAYPLWYRRASGYWEW